MFNRVVNRLLQQGLAESGRARSLCAALAGRRLAITVPGVPWSVAIESQGETLHAHMIASAGTTTTSDTKTAFDAKISGGVISLLALMGPDAQAIISRGDVHIDGDVDIAQQFRELAALMKPNIEAALGGVVGHVPAHLLARATRQSISWGRDSARTALTNVAEYLIHEHAVLVPRAQAEQFLHGVDALREQIDRAEARVRSLERAGEHSSGDVRPGS